MVPLAPAMNIHDCNSRKLVSRPPQTLIGLSGRKYLNMVMEVFQMHYREHLPEILELGKDSRTETTMMSPMPA